MRSFLCAGTAVWLIAAPVSAFAAGAIAVDLEAGRTPETVGYGHSSGFSSRDQAGAAALAECRRRGNANCKLRVRFDVCGAFAVSPQTSSGGWGNSDRAARAAALNQCGAGCQIVVAVCD